MLSLTRKTDYALLALGRLAGEPGQVLSAREIAEQFGVSLPLLMNVLKQLSSAVQSIRGARGGYVLARPAEDISLAELIDATEGPARLAPCVGTQAKEDCCDLGQDCPVHGSLSWLHVKLQGFLQNITLAEMVSVNAKSADLEGAG